MLQETFAGVDRLLLISTDGEEATRIRQHTAAVEAAKAAGVGLIAYTSAGNGKVGWALQEDYAEAIATVLVDPKPTKSIYELSGPLHTQQEIAGALGQVLGRPVHVNQVDAVTYTAILEQAGVPEFLLPMLQAIQEGIAAGTLAVESQDFEEILGRPPVSLEDGLRQLVQR
ncbi:hypothetical protein [Exiguobacterium sp. s192]|uniref:hypothetical protein n=1 Tax=Exiguobacterium sp. s192 TaxID=2751206 RepID=UPI001BEA7D17|nr:hypothetical protein [Exiguobacterium sp. s192]